MRIKSALFYNTATVSARKCTNSKYGFGRILLLYGSLRGDKLGNRHSEGAATYIININCVEEFY
jgi:hypothetical protein